MGKKKNKKKQKQVRIDKRTVIVVDENIPDDIARQRFLTKQKLLNNDARIKGRRSDAFREI